MNIKKIMVIGSGQMGSGIAQVCAQSGYLVLLNEGSTADVIIEAVTENFEIKKSLFQSLDKMCPAHTILASNTSSLPITKIAAATKRPGKVIGMHFMNPVPKMQLVEIIRGLETTDNTFETIYQLAKSLNKHPVAVNDYPGFVSQTVYSCQ